MTDPLLTVADVAETLAISQRQVRRMTDERTIPFLRIGNQIRFDPDDLNDWLTARHIQPRRTG